MWWRFLVLCMSLGMAFLAGRHAAFVQAIPVEWEPSVSDMWVLIVFSIATALVVAWSCEKGEITHDNGCHDSDKT